MSTEAKEITLTVREISQLAKFAGLVVDSRNISELDDWDFEYTVIERPDGTPVGDENGNNPKLYRHVSYITDYPSEGTMPLGEEMPL